MFRHIFSESGRHHIPCGYVRNYCAPLPDFVRPLITERDQRRTDDSLGDHTFVPKHTLAHTNVPTQLCPDSFVPTLVCAHPRLWPDMIVPTHVWTQTHLCPDTFVPTHICALTCYNREVIIMSGK